MPRSWHSHRRTHYRRDKWIGGPCHDDRANQGTSRGIQCVQLFVSNTLLQNVHWRYEWKCHKNLIQTEAKASVTRWTSIERYSAMRRLPRMPNDLTGAARWSLPLVYIRAHSKCSGNSQSHVPLSRSCCTLLADNRVAFRTLKEMEKLCIDQEDYEAHKDRANAFHWCRPCRSWFHRVGSATVFVATQAQRNAICVGLECRDLRARK
jgi:hypothetical protein